MAKQRCWQKENCLSPSKSCFPTTPTRKRVVCVAIKSLNNNLISLHRLGSSLIILRTRFSTILNYCFHSTGFLRRGIASLCEQSNLSIFEHYTFSLCFALVSNFRKLLQAHRSYVMLSLCFRLQWKTNKYYCHRKN